MSLPEIKYEGINQFARVMQNRMQNVSESPLVLDFGVIQSDYSLQTNTFALPIPVTDYLVCRQLTLGNTDDVLTKTAVDGGHTHSVYDLDGKSCGSTSSKDHAHQVLIPEKMRWIKPGDRVLVAWVESDAIVIDLIVKAEVVK